jgi:hypothetical protein
MVLLLCGGQYASAEIPHENFDIIGTDVDMVVQLLKQGINATELALISCLDDRPYNGSRNLTLLDSILVPTSELISEIKGIATSYYTLDYLLPPFKNLSAGGHLFISDQTSYLNSISELRTYVGKPLINTEIVKAKDLLQQSRATTFEMNYDLDKMDTAASGIANLTVDNVKVFNTTYLKELIDKLRIKITDYENQLDNLFFIIQWGESFILVITDKTDYYLDEAVKITGYLYSITGPVVGKGVDIYKDLTVINSTATNDGGAFLFFWNIPVDANELGPHNITVRATVNGTTYDDTKKIVIHKIPTFLSLIINGVRFPPGNPILTKTHLRDYWDRPVIGRIVTIRLDNVDMDKFTNAAGEVHLDYNSTDFDWGRHFMSARFGGTSVYEPSSNDTQHFDVNLNTTLDLEISSHRVRKGENVSIKAQLYANNSRPFSDRGLTIKIDNEVLTVDTTDQNGSVYYLLDTGRVSAGTHVIQAWFFSTEPKYQDAISPALMLIVYVQSGGENQQNNDWWNVIAGNIYWILLIIIIIILLAVLLLSRDTIENVKTIPTTKKAQLKEASEVSVDKEAGALGIMPPSLSISDALQGFDFSIMPAKLAIIRRYGMLLNWLYTKRGVPIRANMTAREISDLLVKTGYPAVDIQRLTRIFEEAKYSLAEMTQQDLDEFVRLIETVQTLGGALR